MKYIYTILCFVLLSNASFSQESTSSRETTTYYFIRHAEKDRSNPQDRNPNLTEAGKSRSKRWSEVLQHVKFDAVYSTNYNRTLQTAQPTAKKNNLNVETYNPRALGNSEFIDATKGKTVLIVGHSNTTPAFVNAVIKKQKYKDIDDSNNANLYIVTISKNGDITDNLLVIE